MENDFCIICGEKMRVVENMSIQLSNGERMHFNCATKNLRDGEELSDESIMRIVNEINREGKIKKYINDIEESIKYINPYLDEFNKNVADKVKNLTEFLRQDSRNIELIEVVLEYLEVVNKVEDLNKNLKRLIDADINEYKNNKVKMGAVKNLMIANLDL